MALSLSPFVGSGVPIAAGAATLPTPPVVWGQVLNWITAGVRCVPELELSIWADATVNLTGAGLYAGRLHAFTLSADAMDSADHTVGTGTFTDVAHGLFTGDGPVRLTTSGTLPAGLKLLTDYWVIKSDADTLQLAASFADAIAGTPVVVPFTDNGTGTTTLTGTAACQRMHWHQKGKLLGPAEDGAIALTNTKAWTQRLSHDPLTFAYAICATVSANTCSATIYPVQSR
jgi:hypothetical protein